MTIDPCIEQGSEMIQMTRQLGQQRDDWRARALAAEATRHDLTWSIQVWETMTRQEQERADKAIARAEQAEALLREVLENDGWKHHFRREDDSEEVWCGYCERDLPDHISACPIARARMILEVMHD